MLEATCKCGQKFTTAVELLGHVRACRLLADRFAARDDQAAALLRLVAALDDDSAMSGFNWRTYLTRPAYEDDEPCPLADAWAEVARVCPAAPPVYEPAMGTGMYFTPTEIAALAGATDDDEVTP